MPTYSYKCDKCGHTEDKVRAMSKRDQTSLCPAEVPEGLCDGVMRRDVVGSMTAHTDMGYQQPILSDALGIHPSQIPEATRRFPHHKYAPDGRMILESHGQRNKVLRELGFHDKN